jgi:hypothetical protein
MIASGPGFRFGASDFRKREPQNTEQGIMNVEGKEKVHHSKFLVRYSIFKTGKVDCLGFPESRLYHLSSDT